jgi:hypothetical protein
MSLDLIKDLTGDVMDRIERVLANKPRLPEF